MRPVIHVGLAKAASTFLQRSIFAKHSNVNYLGKGHVDPDLRAAVTRMSRQNSFFYSGEEVGSVFRNKLIADSARVPILSEEDFCGMQFVDTAMMASRIKEIFSGGRIILVTRNQQDWAQSKYFFYLENFKREALFGLDAMLSEDNLRWVGSYFGPFFLNKIATLYENLFGKENLLVVPYEKLKNNSGEFIREVSQFCDIDASESIKLKNVGEGRAENKFRISPARAQFIQQLRFVITKDARGLARNLLPMIDQRLPVDQFILAEKYIEKGEFNYEEWAQWGKRNVKYIPDDRDVNGRPVEPLGPKATAKIRNVARVENASLERKYNLDLKQLGYILD
ncbi:sulfotransferase domain-containing protein [Simiduia aestuariiviva]|uniref:Sulfotransferase domain-containing protein n=1 Tax=Simiduia aestuariiviva TaxID=1510459 RepID=A0A839UR75_9GAMM|nr:sulfotransferase domain-containing protein [Simiduia aestuariiviva]MBB3168366.1 hypothetical protein [Simiduia aestuariiviva]